MTCLEHAIRDVNAHILMEFDPGVLICAVLIGAFAVTGVGEHDVQILTELLSGALEMVDQFFVRKLVESTVTTVSSLRSIQQVKDATDDAAGKPLTEVVVGIRDAVLQSLRRRRAAFCSWGDFSRPTGSR